MKMKLKKEVIKYPQDTTFCLGSFKIVKTKKNSFFKETVKKNTRYEVNENLAKTHINRIGE